MTQPNAETWSAAATLHRWIHGLAFGALSLGVATSSFAQTRVDLPTLKTRPERTEYRETSRYDDVVAFMEAVDRASPLIHLTTFGYTFEGRALPLAVVGNVKDASPQAVLASGKTRIYIQGNIHAGEIRQVTEEVDARSLVGQRLALRATLKRSDQRVEILLGETAIERNPYTGRPMNRRLDVKRPEMMYEYGSFEATETERVPRAYYIPARLEAAIERLQAHGVRLSRLESDETLPLERFRIDKTSTAPQPFQNHQERTVEGAYEPVEQTLPAGTVVVSMDQPLARLALLLLEPRSDDGLLDWNVLDDAVKDAKDYPIVRSRD